MAGSEHNAIEEQIKWNQNFFLNVKLEKGKNFSGLFVRNVI
jgi:hypothetical protein